MIKLLLRRLLVGLLFTLPLLQAQAQDRLATRGTRFWLGFPQNAGGTPSLRVHISAATATSGTVSVPQTGWSTNFTVSANGSTEVVLPATLEHSGSETIASKGVLVVTDQPANVTAMSVLNFSSEASVVFPETALGTNYRAQSFRAVSGYNGYYRSEFLIVATADDTEIRITPSVNTSGGHAAGVPFTIQLDAGQSYQVQGIDPAADVTGSHVEATAASGPCRPFAVFGGAMCAEVPVGCGACNHLFDQLIPVSMWGRSFHTVPMGASTQFTYRILALENNTVVNVNGQPPVTLSAGQRVDVSGAQQQVFINASKVVSVGQLHEGYACANGGDPSLFSLFPDDALSLSSTFSTITFGGSVVHSVNIVSPVAGIGQVLLDGTPVPASSFQAYAGDPTMKWASVPVSPGTHHISSPVGFLAYVAGRNFGDSYVFPAADVPHVPVNTDSLFCGTGATVTLNTPITLSGAVWTSTMTGAQVGTGNSATVPLTGGDTIVVAGALPVSGCPRSYRFIIGQQLGSLGGPVLDVSADGAGTAQVCANSAVLLSSQPAMDPQWFDMQWTPAQAVSTPHAPNATAYPEDDTWFKLTVTSPVGCGTTADSVRVEVEPSDIRAVRATTADQAICSGDQVALQARTERVLRRELFGSTLPTWLTVQGGQLSTACSSVSGNALYFNGTGVRSATTGPLDLSNGGRIYFALKIAAGTAPCEDADPGEDVVLEHSLNGTTWTVLTTYSESAYPAFTFVEATIPALSATARIRLRQLSNSGAGQDNWALDNLTITNYSNTGIGLSWTPAGSLTGATTGSPVASPTTDTWYRVTATAPSGCAYTDSVFVSVAPAFQVLSIADTVRCSSDGIQFHAQTTSGSGIQWSWTPSSGLSATNIADPMATPAANTNYVVTATNDIGCTDQEAVQVLVGQVSNVNATTSDANLCQGEQAQLTAAVVATGPYTVAWSPVAGVASPNSLSTSVSPGSTTTYTCTVTDTGSGCTRSASVTVNVNTTYVVGLQADTTLCSVLGHQLQLTHNVPGNPTFSWSHPEWLNASNIAQPTIMEDTSATWTVVITDANGCSVSASTTIGVAFDNLITPVTVNTCAGGPLVLDAEFPGSLYEWTTGSTGQTITVEEPGAYTVMITDEQLCQVVKTFHAVFDPLPTVDLGPDLHLCGPTSHVLDAGTSPGQVLWSTGAQTAQLPITTSGTYSVAVTSPAGCTSRDTVTVGLFALPVDPLQDVTACIESPPVLHAGNPGSQYQWSNGAQTQTVVAEAGIMSVTVTTPDDCSATFDAVITLAPLVEVDLGPDTVLCSGQELVLDAGNPGAGHTWNGSAGMQTLTVTASGTYTVQVSNGYCQAGDAVQVVFDPVPQDHLLDVTVCEGTPVVLDAGNADCTYLWSDGSTDRQLEVVSNGTYSVVITNAYGCSGTFVSEVVFVPPPVVELGGPYRLCEGSLQTLLAGTPGLHYTWSTGSSASSVQVGHPGTYWVAVDNGHCVVRDTAVVQVDPVPNGVGAYQLFMCLDEPDQTGPISAGGPDQIYLWNTGATTAEVMPDRYGTYIVTITNNFGCSLVDSVVVNEFCQATIYVPNTFTPNGDGLNDVWHVAGKNIGEFELLVFDRWGGIAFETNDPAKGWDGRIHGQDAKNDMYAWRMRWRFIEDSSGRLGFERIRTGSVQIMK